jgi:hypothetical protein
LVSSPDLTTLEPAVRTIAEKVLKDDYLTIPLGVAHHGEQSQPGCRQGQFTARQLCQAELQEAEAMVTLRCVFLRPTRKLDKRGPFIVREQSHKLLMRVGVVGGRASGFERIDGIAGTLRHFSLPERDWHAAHATQEFG